MQTSLRLTVDDFGLSRAVNAAVVDLAEKRRISAVSVMVHADADLEHVSALARSGVMTGLHLCFVEERPLTPAAKLDGLVDARGRLPRSYRELFKTVVRRPALLDRIRLEAEAQLSRFEQLGLSLDFINSHQHAHLFPLIWWALRPVFARFESARVRGVPHWIRARGAQALVNVAGLVSFRALPSVSEERVIVPLGISQAGHLDGAAVRRALREFRRARVELPSGARAELVLHPGFEDRALLNRYCHWKYRWRAEYDALEQGAIAAAIRECGFSLEEPTAWHSA